MAASHEVQRGNTLTSTPEIAVRSEAVATDPGRQMAETSSLAPASPVARDSPSDGLDAEGIRRYRIALAVEARRFKRYPPRALIEDIGGTVEVRVELAAAGQSPRVMLTHSSGHELLDDAALDMVRKAVPRTVVPEALRRQAFAVNLPVVFDLANE